MIPQEIKQHPYWCVRKQKIPYNPKTGNMAKPNNPATFGTYEEAAAVVERYDGFGVSLREGLSAVDIDHCITDGQLSAMAQEVIDTVKSYTEISPSGEGIRILFRSHGVTYDKERFYFKNSNIGLELYLSDQTDRYVTVTGNEHPQSCPIRALTQEEVNTFAERYMLRPQKKDKPTDWDSAIGGHGQDLDVDTIIEKAQEAKNGTEFATLYRGDWSNYQSQSEADLAFCNLLAFWCHCDYAKMDSIFRQSGLYRSKWDEKHGGKTYGEMTLGKAIDDCMNTYEGYKGKDGEGEQKEKQEKAKAEVIFFSEVEYKDPEFLISPYIPQGKITIIQGDSGIGKTALLCKLAAEVSNGGGILQNPCKKGKALILSVEDDPEVLRGRIESSGGDLNQCAFIKCDENMTFESKQIEQAIKQYKFALVAFDPFQAFFAAGKDMNKANEVRHVMTYLNRIATENNCAVVVIAHMSKGSAGGKAIYRALGSLDIIAASRSALYVGHSPDEQNLCVVAHIKSSNAKKGRSFTYRIGERGSVEWQGYSHLQAEDLERVAARKEKGIDYEMEPLVQVVRRLITENPNGLFIGYDDFLNYAFGVLQTRPYRDGKELRKALDGLSTEIMQRDKIKIDFSKRRVQPFVQFEEMHIPECTYPVKGITFSNYDPPGFGQPSLLGAMNSVVDD